MDEAPEFEPEHVFCESRHSALNKLISLVFPVFLMLLVMWPYLPHFFDGWVPSAAVCLYLIFGIAWFRRGLVIRPWRALARVGERGLWLKSGGNKWLKLDWSEIQSVEFPKGQAFSNVGFVHFRRHGHPKGSRQLPLTAMDRATRKAFRAALQLYWPGGRESR